MTDEPMFALPSNTVRELTDKFEQIFTEHRTKASLNSKLHSSETAYENPSMSTKKANELARFNRDESNSDDEYDGHLDVINKKIHHINDYYEFKESELHSSIADQSIDTNEITNDSTFDDIPYIWTELIPFDRTTNDYCSLNETEQIRSTPIAELQETDEISNNPTVDEIRYIWNELIQVERQYTATLRQGIVNYLNEFSEPEPGQPWKLPAALRGQKFHIFRNVERILDFHERVFGPAIAKCQPNVVRLCIIISRFIKKEKFYPYVVFAVTFRHAECLILRNATYFRCRQKELGDKLGVSSFLLQPIQLLPRYQLLIQQMIKTFAKSPLSHQYTNQIAACTDTVADLQRMLDRINASMSLNDFDVNDDQLQILHLGMLQYVATLSVQDWLFDRPYPAKMFLMVKGVLITMILSKNDLEFRHFLHCERLAVREDNHGKLELFDLKDPMKMIVITTDSSTLIQIKNILCDRNVVVRIKMREKKNSQHRRIQRKMSEWFLDTDDTETNKDEPSTSIKTRTRNAKRNSIWYTEVSLIHKGFGPVQQRLYNSEKFYTRILQKLQKMYEIPAAAESTSKPSVVIFRQLIRVKQMLCFHRDLFSSLIKCTDQLDIVRSYVQHFVEIDTLYLCYAAECAETLQQLNGSFPQNQLIDIKDLMHFPHYQMERRRIYIRQMKNEVPAENCFSSKNSDRLECLLSECSDRIKDNLMINMTRALVFATYGLVVYAESVTMCDEAHRLLLLEHGLACVRTIVDTTCEDTHFNAVDFLVPIKVVVLKNHRKPTRLCIRLPGKVSRIVDFVSRGQRVAMRNAFRKYKLLSMN